MNTFGVDKLGKQLLIEKITAFFIIINDDKFDRTNMNRSLIDLWNGECKKKIKRGKIVLTVYYDNYLLETCTNIFIKRIE